MDNSPEPFWTGFEKAAGRQDVVAAVKEELSRRAGPRAGVITGMTRWEDLPEVAGFDDLDMVEAVMALEDKFGVEIRDDELERVQTIRDLANLIERKMGQNGGAGQAFNLQR